MTDRDHFACAALPFVAKRGLTDEQVAAHCYRWADEMLRQRVTEPMPKDKRAEVLLRLTDEEREVLEKSTWLLPRKEADAILAIIRRLG